MAKCAWCGKKFNVSNAREEYNTAFEGDIDYDEQYEGGDICADCAIADTESNMSVGRAIDMVNGDEDYDDDFVQRWL